MNASLDKNINSQYSFNIQNIQDFFFWLIDWLCYSDDSSLAEKIKYAENFWLCSLL